MLRQLLRRFVASELKGEHRINDVAGWLLPDITGLDIAV